LAIVLVLKPLAALQSCSSHDTSTALTVAVDSQIGEFSFILAAPA
jgi:predicted Kef-type K+ transport protein